MENTGNRIQGLVVVDVVVAEETEEIDTSLQVYVLDAIKGLSICIPVSISGVLQEKKETIHLPMLKQKKDNCSFLEKMDNNKCKEKKKEEKFSFFCFFFFLMQRVKLHEARVFDYYFHVIFKHRIFLIVCFLFFIFIIIIFFFFLLLLLFWLFFFLIFFFSLKKVNEILT